MSDAELDPILPPDANIAFHDAHRPALQSGDYRLSHSLHLKEHSAAATDEKFGGNNYQAFSVAGPRFSLGPESIHSCFPPDRASGDFASSLPHVALKRATLPWERSAFQREDPTSPPWLALLVLDASKIVKTQVVPVKKALSLVGLTAEASDDVNPANPKEAEKVTVITLSQDTAKKALPDLATLRLLSHVRTVEYTPQAKPAMPVPATINAEMSMVVASQRPMAETGKSVKNVVHLVSVEGLYRKGRKTPVLSDTTVHLVSLSSWEFFADTPRHGFKELLLPIAEKDKQKRFGKPAPDAADNATSSNIKNGWTPVLQQLRNGEQTYSWYHGPLVGDRRSLPAVDLPRIVSNADALTLLNPKQGMMDISYSSAWELGRLTIQSRPNVARALAKWKREDDQYKHAVTAQTNVAHLPHGVTPPQPSDFTPLLNFFRADLAELRAVPFRYLVADPDLLPLESLRFFDLDQTWVSALIDGAFSVGRATSKALKKDAERSHVLPEITAKSGFLLRSSAVSAFRGLQFDGYASVVADQEKPKPSQPPIEIVRAERIGPNTLLVLFAEQVRTLDLHLHAQAMHFALPANTELQSNGHVNFMQVGQTLGLSDDAINSATLARRLVKGVPLVRIVREAAI